MSGSPLAGHGGGPIEIWDRAGWRRLHTIETGPIDGWDGATTVGTWRWEGDPFVKVLDTFTGRVAQTLSGHTGGVQLPAGVRMAGGLPLRSRRRQDVEPEDRPGDILARRCESMAWSHDRKRIATVSHRWRGPHS